MKPERNHVKPERNHVKPERNHVKPERNHVKPERKHVKPERKHVKPERKRCFLVLPTPKAFASFSPGLAQPWGGQRSINAESVDEQ